MNLLIQVVGFVKSFPRSLFCDCASNSMAKSAQLTQTNLTSDVNLIPKQNFKISISNFPNDCMSNTFD